MRPGDADVEPEWVWVLLSSTKLLTVGSLLLLAGPLSILGLGRFPSVFWVYGFLVIAFLVYGLYILILTFLGAFVLTVIGVLSHLTAWAGLSESADLTRSMRLAFRLSIVGFVAGVLFVTIQTPSPGLFLLFGGWIWFPFLPIVYGPVVIAHAILFLLASGKIRPPYRRHLVAGSAIDRAVAPVLDAQPGRVRVHPGMGDHPGGLHLRRVWTRDPRTESRLREAVDPTGCFPVEPGIRSRSRSSRRWTSTGQAATMT